MMCAIGIGLMLAGFILAVAGILRIVGSPDWQWSSTDEATILGDQDAK